MKIVVADDVSASAAGVLTAEPGWTVDARRGRSAAELAHDLGDADALIVRSRTRVDAALLAAAPGLRIVARAGAGVDNVDVAAATARGVLVVNAAGANSVSVAEHACALMLALARRVPAADRGMKDGRWEKNQLVGTELRGKTLAIIGFGRIGQELARRARAFEMRILAHDPFIARDIAGAAGAELVSLEEACAAADYLSLHLPVTDRTRSLFDAARFATCKRGIRIVNTARGELVDEGALAAAIADGVVAGAALDVFAAEPPQDWALARLPQVIATPHVAGSTEEAQELVGLETAAAVRDYLRDGIVRNAVNFPSIAADDMARLLPWIRLAERLGTLAALLSGPSRVDSLGVRYYGAIAERRTSDVLAASAAAGVLRPILSSSISLVNARDVARARGVDIVESRSSRERPYTSLLSVKIRSDRGEAWVEGTVLEPGAPRLVSIQGIAVEAPLTGTIIVVANDDRPGVIGEVGTILGRHGINIANFALGRRGGDAIGLVNVDAEPDGALDAAVAEMRSAVGVRDVWVAAV